MRLNDEPQERAGLTDPSPTPQGTPIRYAHRTARPTTPTRHGVRAALPQLASPGPVRMCVVRVVLACARLEQTLLVLEQLHAEALVRVRAVAELLHALDGVDGRHPLRRHEVRGDDGRAPADALHTVHEHPRVRIAERVHDPGRRPREVGRELDERVVLDRDLPALERLVWREVGEVGGGGERDVPGHHTEDVRDAQCGEDVWGLGCREVAEEHVLGNLYGGLCLEG